VSALLGDRPPSENGEALGGKKKRNRASKKACKKLLLFPSTPKRSTTGCLSAGTRSTPREKGPSKKRVDQTPGGGGGKKRRGGKKELLSKDSLIPN